MLFASSTKFHKSLRVLTQGDFNRVFSFNKKYHTSHLTVLIHRRKLSSRAAKDSAKFQGSVNMSGNRYASVQLESLQTPDSRLGLIVSKKYSKKAINRNRFKRLCREAFRLLRPELDCGYDIVIMAKKRVDNGKKNTQIIKRKEEVQQIEEPDVTFKDIKESLYIAAKRAGVLKSQLT